MTAHDAAAAGDPPAAANPTDAAGNPAGGTTTPGVPDWLHPLLDAAGQVRPEQLSRFRPPETGGRAAAVLILFGSGPAGPDVLLIERADTLRQHAGQPAFPGGAVDPEDVDRAATAVREAQEEVGLDPAGVDVLADLPPLYLPVTGYVVTPVLGWWRMPSPVGVVDPGEVARVVRIPLTELTDPVNRFQLRHPSGHLGPAFDAGGLLVWGFTAMLLDRLLELGGWARPWDERIHRALPTAGPGTVGRTDREAR